MTSQGGRQPVRHGGWVTKDDDDDANDDDDDDDDARKENVQQRQRRPQPTSSTSQWTSPLTSPEKRRNIRNLHEMTV